jgi:hypothetical protein
MLGAILPLHDVRYLLDIGRARFRDRAEIARPHQAWRPGASAQLSFHGRAKLRSKPKSIIPAGGARRDRTDDLLLAKQALSQLSYGPSAMASDQRSKLRMTCRRLIADA